MLLLLSAVLSHAQGMSDAQVMRYIQREVKAGTSQSQIAVKLMQRGVDMKQLQRVRQQVNAGQVSSQSTSSTSSGSVDGSSRLRKSNGSVMVDVQGNPLYSPTSAFAMGAAGEIQDIGSRPNVYLPDSMSTRAERAGDDRARREADCRQSGDQGKIRRVRQPEL